MVIAMRTLKEMPILAIRKKMRMNRNLSGSNQYRQGGVLSRPALSSAQRGFTLIEVIIVMAIMAIVAGIGITSFADWRNKQAVNSATQALMSHLKQARVKAVADNRSISVKFTSSSYVFDAVTPDNSPCGLCKKEVVLFTQFTKNLTISSAATRTFSSRGTANTGNITVASESSSKVIKINRIGRAYLQ